MIEYPIEPGTPVSHLPFSPATRVGEFVFVSGQASVDPTGKYVADTFEGEVRRSIENLKKVLETAGSDLAHVVMTRNYVRNASDVAEFNRIYPEYFKAPYPARTTITNCLGTLLYEIDCTAVVKGAKG
ncbi:MAG TPA: RidA family protein [Devosia sp.]|nr:RidA family protein [Devosia sp.]